ncbi:MAG: hypothetical protein LPK00_10280 [Bacillaceae bacterium]|nr:hypothetical protein [Bacillaceae bacterium]
MDKNQKLLQNAYGLLDLKKKKSFPLFKSSLFLFEISRTRKLLLGLVGLVLFNLFYFVLFKQVSAVTLITEISNKINGIIIPIFAVIITGYAIFQALANGPTLIRMVSVKHESNKTETLSKFAVYNLYFYGLSIFYLFLIVINFFLSITLSFIDDNWSLIFISKAQNEIISSILITIYILVVLNFLIELKSFIFNLFQIFITNGVNATTQHLEEENSKN